MKNQDSNDNINSAFHLKLLSNIQNVIVIVNSERKITYKSPNIERHFGWRPEELTGQDAMDNIHEEDVNNVLQVYQSILKKPNSTGSAECRYKCRNGTYKWIKVTGTNMLHDKDINGILASYQDISESKKAEMALKKSEAILRSTMEAMTDALLIVSSEGKVTHYNTRFKEIFAIPEDLMIQQKDSLLIEYAKDLFANPEDFLEKVKKIYHSSDSTKDIIEMKDKRILERFSYPLLEGSPVKGRVWIFRDVTEQKQNEDYLRKFKITIDNSLDGVLWTNREGNFDYVNKQACKMLGYSYDELIKINLFQLDPFYSKKAFDERWNKFLRTKKSEGIKIETFHKKKDGTFLPIEVISNYIWAEGKEVHVAYSRDISERKKKEEILLQFKISIDKALDAVYWINEEGGFDYVNEQASKMLGYTHDELIRLHLPDIDPAISIDSHKKSWERLCQNKKLERVSLERKQKKKDGSLIPVEINSIFIWMEKKGFQVTYVKDISERKEFENNILKRQKMLSDSQRIAQIGCWELDLVHNKLFWTPEAYQIYGYKYNEIEPSLDLFLQLVHPDDVEIATNHYQRTLKIKKFEDFECRIIRPDGKVISIIVAGEIVFDEKRNPVRFFGIIQDITERKLIEEERKRMNMELEKRVQERTIQLNQANKDLEAFSYSVSHDLRAPVRHIDGFVKLLYNIIGPLEEKAQGYFDKINASTKGMSVMLDELLKFSRLGRKELNYSNVDLSALVMEVLEQFKPDYANRKIQWKISKLPVVKGDPTLLKLVLENLISNALKYTGKKEIAEIEIGEGIFDPDFVTFYIKDNGAGFDMAYKEKLFNVFQRLHRNEEFEGIGIGLANVKQIIAKHNGRIDVEAEVNKGATFYITLPQ
jgi:PAS domain S-box-containing protein